ncbi:hypothetical protein [uncultured Nitratireductor sp.]|uniref:hypothetical protein n=1 Tax=uncultured Nitratireductor sp. TaxID=520953 RepID=UPI0025D6551E|nr:hypothetical protein [uncultured Nitratireductor sp.]
MPLSVISFEGPVGVGKTTLGRAVSSHLGFGFVDGDDHSLPGPWLRSILQTSRRIARACEEQLETRPVVIMAYPLRCTNWLFFRETFRRRGIAYYCISLAADAAHIAARERLLTPDEMARSSQMTAQGYGQRPFSDLVIRTDKGGFAFTRDHLADKVRGLVSGPSQKQRSRST